MCNKMSDVRLSNASPTLERVDARQADSHRPSVRRNLFGTPDPEEVRRRAAELVREDVHGFRARYNFDPLEDRPLAGNFRWVRDDDPPEFYLRPPHGSQRGEDDDDAERRRRSAAAERNGSRKRRSEGSGSCSIDCQSKMKHTDEDDEDGGSDGAGSQALNAAERSASGPENSAEVH